jgi:hypothetical protein
MNPAVHKMYEDLGNMLWEHMPVPVDEHMKSPDETSSASGKGMMFNKNAPGC